MKKKFLLEKPYSRQTQSENGIKNLKGLAEMAQIACKMTVLIRKHDAKRNTDLIAINSCLQEIIKNKSSP